MSRHKHKREPELVAIGTALSAYSAPPEYPGQTIRGRRDRRIIGRDVVDGRQYDLHATKGYRATRV